jgi:DNA-binding FadR family transcriptional regulator
MINQTSGIPGDLADLALEARDRSGSELDELGLAATRSANTITARLVRAIETGVYADGDQLPPERQLALALGTARSTIRKALDQIEARGLVVRKVGSGTFVNYSGPLQATGTEIADLVSPLQLIETRFAVEPYMTRLACIHANRRDIDSFETVLQKIEGCGTDQDQFTQWDMEFHMQLARCSRNPLMLRIYHQINAVRAHAQWSRVKRAILTGDKIAAYNRQHRSVFEALAQRNVQGAVDIMTAHLEMARQDIMGVDNS